MSSAAAERHDRSSRYPRRVCGVDFSGAQDAGQKIWIASGVIEGGVLRIEDCRSARELPGSGKDRDRCLAALRDFIAGSGDCVFGLDFPFGLPAPLVKEDSWEDFVLSFPDRYSGPDEFKQTCLHDAGGKELKRHTELEARAPFAAYNLRLYKQTYFGIRDVLAPLVRGGKASVLPMQKAEHGKPRIIEICPASTLEKRGLSYHYKGRTWDHARDRRSLVKAMKAAADVSIPDGLHSRIVEDHGGDGVDSIVAASAVFRDLPDLTRLGKSHHDYAIEGFIYTGVGPLP